MKFSAVIRKAVCLYFETKGISLKLYAYISISLYCYMSI